MRLRHHLCTLARNAMCSFFFLYDGSKVRGEGDPTREGICYFYPEETPLDRQELLCGQLAGVGRCVSELSVSPVRVLRLRRDKFAIRMKDDLFWALGTSVEVPTVSVCALLDQLINLFRFYNGSVRRSYQIHSRETLAARWAQYLSHLQSGSSELHHIFSCLRTIDSTNVGTPRSTRLILTLSDRMCHNELLCNKQQQKHVQSKTPANTKSHEVHLCTL
uniref:CCZ1/INTU/HSP4 first Longin domain-containing protein n=1 Tax=Mola mola TaxID=94237 RepID=A0A3Q3WG69_MOLML